ncbi:site-specific integrase [Halomonas salipaludis]|nr:site-specific integrase [Halomonas salipaludis]
MEIKDFLEMKLVSGSSLTTVEGYLSDLQLFLDFFDQNGKDVNINNLADAYLEYCENLFQKCNKKPPDIKKTTAIGYASSLSTIFGEILEIPRSVSLVNRTRLEYPSKSKKAVGREADKQNLEDTYKMGSFLIDLSSGITIDTVLGQLPLRIPIRNALVDNNEIIISLNKTRVVNEDAVFQPPDSLTKEERRSVNQIKKSRAPVDSIIGTKRGYLVTLRVTAEFLIFIAQSGMNVTTAESLKRSEFKYKPIGEKWHVRAFKRRRGGEVMFSIYKSYKPHLQKYLTFIDHFFPESDLLFPWCDMGGRMSSGGRVLYKTIRNLLEKHDIPWIQPKTLRNTRSNWFLRRSGGDEELTSEMLQHVKETLRENYELPSQQRAAAEITKFWHSGDPIKQGDLKVSIISGQCSGEPVPMEDKPLSIVSPNCSNQSGCLWCKNMRDIDSLDYVWSLASFRHLKTIEAAGITTRETIPADIVIERLTKKMTSFKEGSKKRKEWVDEAEMRVAEGDYHPHWSGILEFLEE